MYNPDLPLTMKFVGQEFCGDNREQMMVVGKIPADSEERPEIIFRGNGTDEAFHIRIDVDAEFVERWANQQNATTGAAGYPGDGTSVDRDEPFVIRLACTSWRVRAPPGLPAMRTAGCSGQTRRRTILLSSMSSNQQK